MIGRLHVITDFFFQQKRSHAELAELAIRGGADCIQFRQKHGSNRHRMTEARAIASIARKSDLNLIINDEISIALAVGADGVHLGQEDFPLIIARQLLGDSAIIGASATTLAQARRAERDGADYIGFGPVFLTRSKPNPASTKGLGGLEEVCANVSIPVVAIGGIKPEHVASVFETGAHGIAVMTAISLAENPQSKTHEFVSEISSFFT